jgi:adenylosuccinate lyase
VSDRYSIPPQAATWNENTRLARWRQIELDAMTHNPRVPNEAASAAYGFPTPSRDAVRVWELSTGHDLVAFLRAWTEDMPVEVSRWVHHGLTSSDIVDTALSRTLVDSTDLLLQDVRNPRQQRSKDEGLLETIKGVALNSREIPRAGRTHGRIAAPTTVGLQLAGLGLLVKRAMRRVQAARREVNVTKLSGPVGAYGEIHPHVEDQVAIDNSQFDESRTALGSTQVVARDGIAAWGNALASLATACEQVATWVRLGAQSGVDELREGRLRGVVGSSAMPHKRNPIRSERVCGLARVVRGHAATLANDVVLWSERDISHSSVERELLESIVTLTHFVVLETRDIVLGLEVNADQCLRNLNSAGSDLRSHSRLTTLTSTGMSYWEAHKVARVSGSNVELTAKEWLEFVGEVEHVYAELEGD